MSEQRKLSLLKELSEKPCYCSEIKYECPPCEARKILRNINGMINTAYRNLIKTEPNHP